MDHALRELVRRRAGGRCEYCQLPQAAVPFAPFHIEHIVAKQHGGDDAPTNLALACDRCNLHKGPNLAGIDPDTGNVVPLFHPRRDTWEEHFRWKHAEIVGRTATGRTTVQLLNMNAKRRLQLRAGIEPPP
jgi:5-methylcytosine-specific restriction endonuclease McrA